MSENAPQPTRICPHCGEENPRAFTMCWSCQADLPAAPAADAPAVEGVEARAAPASAAPAPADEPAADPERRTRLLFELGLVVLVFLVPRYELALWYATQPAPTPTMDPSSVVQSTLYRTLQGLGSFALLAFLFSLDGHWRKRLGLERPRIVKELLWGVGVFCVMAAADGFGFMAASRLGFESPPRHARVNTTGPLWVGLPMILTLALVEEALFRAYLWSRLTELSRRPVLSLAVTSVIFSAVHCYTLPNAIGLLLAAWTMGLIFIERRSLWGLVIGHTLFNLYVTYR